MEIDEKSSQEDVIRAVWIDKVHVDESGYFSDCDEYCDDCFWFYHWNVHTTPRIDEVKRLCSTFQVYGKNGKSYTYYKPNPESIAFLAKNCQTEIESARQEIIKHIADSIAEKERLRQEVIETARLEKLEDERCKTELDVLLKNELGDKYTTISSSKVQGYAGEMLGNFYPKKKYAYPSWTAYKWKGGHGVIVSHKYSYDWDGIAIYVPSADSEKYNSEELNKLVSNPDYWLMSTIIRLKTGDNRFTDFSENSTIRARIVDNEELTTQAIENYKNTLLSTDLTENEIEDVKRWSSLRNEYTYQDNAISGVEALGFADELANARAVKQQKVNELMARCKAEAQKKKEEETRLKEEENLRLKEEAQKKLTALNPHLTIEKVQYGFATIRFDSGLKRTPKSVREAAEAICKKFGGGTTALKKHGLQT
jgi:hypothetical protein